MQLQSLECSNHRTLKEFYADFQPGITGLLGVNGSGKSSFLSALCFSATGTVLGDDTKMDLLNWEATKGYDKLVFSHDNKQYVIKRNLQGSAVDLREVGATKAAFSSREGIDNFMTDLIGLHPRLYDKVLFIAQEDLDSMLLAKHSVRADFFNDLFDATITEKLRDLIQTYIQQIPVFQDNTAEKERIYADTADNRQKGAEAEVQIAALKDALAKLPSMDELLTKAALPLQTQLDSDIKYYEEQAEKYKAVVKLREDTMMPAFITAEREQEYQQYLLMKSHEKAVADAKQTLADLPKPKKEKFMGDKVDKCRDTLAAEQLQITEKLRLCEQGKCPTCGSKYKGANRDDLIKRQEEIKKQLESVDGYLYAEHNIVYTERMLEERDNTCKTFIASASNEVLAFDEPEYIKDKALIESQTIQIDQYRQIEYEAVAAEGILIETNKKIVELNTTTGITPEEAETNKKVSATAQEIQNKLTELEGTRTGCETSISMLGQRLQVILTQEKQEAKYKEYSRVLSVCRDTLHRDCLPQVRVAAGLTMINAKLAEWLDLFNVPFVCYINNDCDFMVSFEGIEKPVKVLSGGQRKVAAIAFRLAVAEIFGSALGVLCIDEPTAYMDVDAVNNLVETLTRVASRAVAKNMFVFISTHEDILMQAFTRTIRFNKGSRVDLPVDSV